MPPPTSRRYAAGVALLRTTAVYATLTWVYLAANSISHPETMDMRLTHFAPWPTERLTLAVALLVSAAAIFTVRYRAYRSGVGGTRRSNS